MNQLETTLIELARQHLAAVQAFYAKLQAGTADEEDRNDYGADHGALFALLELGHLADSGMSAEGAQALRVIEDEHAAAVREVPDCA